MCETLKNNYQVLEELGRGRFGTITRYFSPTRNEFFACKTIDKTLLADDPLDRECLIKEPKIMTVLSPHPNIVQLHDVFDTEECLSLVIDLCDTTTLYDRLVKINGGGGGGFSEARASSVMRQLLVAIDHCHRFNIVHRDIKPDNVLFDSLNRVKLSDFGSADWLGEEGTLNGLVGTPYYVAPEVVLGRNYNEKVDIWSAGVVLYVMLTGIPPFYGETVEEIFEAVIRGNLRFPNKMFKTVSSEAKDLIKKMICRDVSRRISADQALRHPWILSGGDTIEMD